MTSKKNCFRNRIVVAFILFMALTGMFLINCSGPSGDAGSDIETGFQNPPESAKPRVWWHWMNGNVTREGIKADLEWMHRIGIGGFQNFDTSLNTPQIVENRLVYMTPEWKEAFLYTTTLADSLDLEMAIAGSPGWSESGGPWVSPAQAMKKLVWSETHIEGGGPFTGTLPKPPSTTGAFQNTGGERGFSLSGAGAEKTEEYYADAIVIAFRAPEKDIPMTELLPTITSSGGKFDLVSLTDGDLAKSTLLPAAPANKKSWLQFEFNKPETIQSLTIVGGGSGGRFGFGADTENRALEASDDGKQFQTVMAIPNSGVGQKTMTFKPVTAKFFRLSVKTPAPQAGPDLSLFGNLISERQPAPAGIQIAEFVLHPVSRVNHFEDKAGFTSAAGLAELATPPIPVGDAIVKTDVIDLSARMKPDGTLEWTPPDGRWIVLRLGYSLTGHKNSPASPEATGLEVDKLNPDHVKAYFENYLDQYKDATGGLMGKRGLQYVITDSWEAGVANWTDNILEEFRMRQGYDILPWLPVLTGRIVGSAEESDRFLWDFRNTLGEMVAEYHYDALTTILHDRGMGRYTESHENGRAFIGDGMEVKRSADIPMSAVWTPGGFGGNEADGVAVRHEADVRESASVAHIYGQNLVAAESMTAIGNAWAFSPERLKPTADMELASGLNRFVIHTSVHQPVDDKVPGLGLGPFGQWFTRHETWGQQATPWITYLARSSFMLQQGLFVADIIYYYSEDNNITSLFGEKLPDIPEGYNYDFINADGLINILSVKKGDIVTPSGMKYRILALDPNSQHMTLPVLLKIRDMVNAGAIVAGPRPISSPSLSDDQDEFRTIADQLWGTETGVMTYGKGKVYTGQTLEEVLTTMQIAPDFKYSKPRDNTNLLFVHRTLPGAEIYWVNNRNNRVEDLEANFRVTGKSAEVWHPETGKIKEASYNIADGRTTVPLRLEPNDAVFIVFRNKADAASFSLPLQAEKQLATIEGSWEVSFQPDRGAPAMITMEDLSSWNDNTDTGVKYFSGTGTYSKIITAEDNWFRDEKLWLDLGNVKNLAEILINDQSPGILWKYPFRVEITDVLKPGDNKIEIKVTNLWVNRLIGDQQPEIAKKITYTTQDFYQANSPLLPSGLLGPVRILGVSMN